ncbi:hypothetical protein CPB83DRAFT_879639 [Crepidotus variabilis]|uniref:Uncharacterized protein n=1 Tax=Crepidotus variabilis TaxID=179855 RepID=A0A9P6ETQ3_9AGAR|nr:hypothetical protein CPB83DRAFT_879639 [Crepidotus variabilis]
MSFFNQDISLIEPCFPLDSFVPYTDCWTNDPTLNNLDAFDYYQHFPNTSGQYVYSHPTNLFDEYGYTSSTTSDSDSSYDHEETTMSEDMEAVAQPREWADSKADNVSRIEFQFEISNKAICNSSDALSAHSTVEYDSPLPIRVPHLVNSPSSSDYGDSDDSFSDYRPSPSPEPVFRKASRSRPYPRQQSSGSSSPQPMTLSPIKNRRGSRRNARSPASRNIQAAGEEAALLEQHLESNRNAQNALVCPHPGCRYHQANGRLPDFRRHLRTHLRKAGQHRCKGVSYLDFLQFPEQFPGISEDALPYIVDGCAGMWIGGCNKTFSRADALKRHYDKQTCVRNL